jgi:hypothetical protein
MLSVSDWMRNPSTSTDELSVVARSLHFVFGMRRWGVAVLVIALACNRDKEVPASEAPPSVDPAQLQNTSGEVTLSDGGQMSYDITSDRYRKWYAAQQSLDHATAAKFGTILKPNSPSAASIAQATAFLERNPATKQSIQRAGLAVADFVNLTVALQQQFRDAERPATQEYSDRPYYVPPPLDTAMPQQPPVQYAPMPTPPPTQVYTPPVYPAPTPQPQTPSPTLPPPLYDRRDSTRDTTRTSYILPPTTRRDTAAPKRDSARPVPPRDSAPPPAAPDTGVKSSTDSVTSKPAPRDSLPRA